MMTPLETLNSLTEKAAAQAFVQSHSHGGSVQLCSDEYVPPLQIKEGETLLIDWDCGGGKSCRIRDRLQDLGRVKWKTPEAKETADTIKAGHRQAVQGVTYFASWSLREVFCQRRIDRVGQVPMRHARQQGHSLGLTRARGRVGAWVQCTHVCSDARGRGHHRHSLEEHHRVPGLRLRVVEQLLCALRAGTYEPGNRGVSFC